MVNGLCHVERWPFKPFVDSSTLSALTPQKFCGVRVKSLPHKILNSRIVKLPFTTNRETIGDVSMENASAERKLKVIEIHVEIALGLPGTYLWVAIPGGLLRGKPIKFDEYLDLLMPSATEIPAETEPLAEPDEDEAPKQERFFHFKDAQLVQGETVHVMRLAIFDGLDVSACGLYDPTK